jgi:hypothetical protein
MIRTLLFWYVLLLTTCVVGPYVLGVRPRRERDWRLLTAVIAFLTWLLVGFAFLRSR